MLRICAVGPLRQDFFYDARWKYAGKLLIEALAFEREALVVEA
jgi:hypothetical protein